MQKYSQMLLQYTLPLWLQRWTRQLTYFLHLSVDREDTRELDERWAGWKLTVCGYARQQEWRTEVGAEAAKGSVTVRFVEGEREGTEDCTEDA